MNGKLYVVIIYINFIVNCYWILILIKESQINADPYPDSQYFCQKVHPDRDNTCVMLLFCFHPISLLETKRIWVGSS